MARAGKRSHTSPSTAFSSAEQDPPSSASLESSNLASAAGWVVAPFIMTSGPVFLSFEALGFALQ